MHGYHVDEAHLLCQHIHMKAIAKRAWPLSIALIWFSIKSTDNNIIKTDALLVRYERCVLVKQIKLAWFQGRHKACCQFLAARNILFYIRRNHKQCKAKRLLRFSAISLAQGLIKWLQLCHISLFTCMHWIKRHRVSLCCTKEWNDCVGNYITGIIKSQCKLKCKI